MIWFLLIATHLFMFALGGLTFWFLTDPRVSQDRNDQQFARSRRVPIREKNDRRF